MTEIEKLVETYLRTDMKAATFMQRRAAMMRRMSRPLGKMDPSGKDPDTKESTPAPTESATETTSTDATAAALVPTSP